MGSLGSCIERIGLLHCLKLIRNKMASSYIYVLSILFLAASASSLMCWKGTNQANAASGTTCSEDDNENRCITITTHATGVVQSMCKASTALGSVTDATSAEGNLECTNTTTIRTCVCKTKDNCNDPTTGCSGNTQLKVFTFLKSVEIIQVNIFMMFQAYYL